ncbi:drug/metabolite transporter (DMT)-like permease [Paenibacillus phyllosphaerae]|uniref:Drug/metabolite transporter (DMT)-like permease n=1 Tax=Paenibacillus phyllosphaerae TaxID=274593 RepID=A0A7W5FRC3_9BACL|nr:DMT family transporter [Paenibacillus phyllosphaerae]MBB3113879.1 drug/metabolite transporter (DMT)-like permease [Paenibacillus phyllosphaerae]
MWLVFSLLAAVSFGLRGTFYHWTSQQQLNRNMLLCGTFFMGVVICAVCMGFSGQQWTNEAWIGVQMGLFSFAANASMFKGFKVGKASVVAIITALPAVVVGIVAFFIWNERLTYSQLVAFVIIIAGILLVRYSNDITLHNLQGAQWGLLALFMFAGNDLTGKYSRMLEAPLYPTLLAMFATGTLCFGLWRLRDWRTEAALKRVVQVASVEGSHPAAAHPAARTASKPQWRDGRTFLVGMGVGITNAVGMMLILSAFELGKAGLVSAIVALNVLLVLLYTRFIVKERFTRLELTGMLTAFAGIVFMRLFS